MPTALADAEHQVAEEALIVDAQQVRLLALDVDAHAVLFARRIEKRPERRGMTAAAATDSRSEEFGYLTPMLSEGLGWSPWAPTALAIAFMLAASCSSTPPKSAAQTEHDQAVANSVYAALDADPVYFFRHVEVRVDNGVAELSGYVWSTDAIYRARQIARGVPGVSSVDTHYLELERIGRNEGPAR